jgi:hypothetical protein
LIRISKVRHRYSGCSCGHTYHVGRSDLTSRDFRSFGSAAAFVVCPQCDEIAEAERVIIATDTVARIEDLAIAPDMIVLHAGRTCRVVEVEPVTRLGGAYQTGFAIVKLRETAA